ncbi:MAG TPA: hypothetical protein VF808_20000 [Ktedonobacterales bacterium]
MWKFYAIGFALMGAFMLIAGVTLFVVTLTGQTTSSSSAASDWLIRAGVAVVLGLFAATLSTLAWRQSRRSAA